jgi:hypothetical protein
MMLEKCCLFSEEISCKMKSDHWEIDRLSCACTEPHGCQLLLIGPLEWSGVSKQDKKLGDTAEHRVAFRSGWTYELQPFDWCIFAAVKSMC